VYHNHSALVDGLVWASVRGRQRVNSRGHWGTFCILLLGRRVLVRHFNLKGDYLAVLPSGRSRSGECCNNCLIIGCQRDVRTTRGGLLPNISQVASRRISVTCAGMLLDRVTRVIGRWRYRRNRRWKRMRLWGGGD